MKPFLFQSKSERAANHSSLRNIFALACAAICFMTPLVAAAQDKCDLAALLFHSLAQTQANPEWRVYAAVVSHDHATLQSVLDQGDSPDGVGRARANALTSACRLGDLESASILIKSGTDIDLADSSDENPLFAATQWHRLDIMRFLLAHGAHVDVPRASNGETALFEALRRRNYDSMTVLIQAGADVNFSNSAGSTPLMLASLDNDKKLIQFLEDNGAKFKSPDEDLLSLASHGDVSGLRSAIAAGAHVNRTYEQGLTPLMAAALNGQTAALKALIAAGADLDARDEIRDTPLMFAIEGGHSSTVLALLDAGADPTLENVAHVSTLHQSGLYMDDPDIVNRLIASGVPVAAGDSINVTPLMNAATFGRYETVKILLAAHVPVNVQSKEGRTALMDAAEAGEIDVVKLLLAAGADPSLRDRKKETALDKAKGMDKQKVVDILETFPETYPLPYPAPID
jgi:ankyrin repeat protein